jgi:type I restriction enzyme S subunit
MNFLKLEMTMPGYSAQSEIARTISDIDAEIAALETKLAKYRHIKQGMMQNLLTGRIRLVQPDSNTGAAA